MTNFMPFPGDRRIHFPVKATITYKDGRVVEREESFPARNERQALVCARNWFKSPRVAKIEVVNISC